MSSWGLEVHPESHGEVTGADASVEIVVMVFGVILSGDVEQTDIVSHAEIEILELNAATRFQTRIEPFVAAGPEWAVFGPFGVIFHFSSHAHGQITAEERLYGEVVGTRVNLVFQDNGDFQIA